MLICAMTLALGIGSSADPEAAARAFLTAYLKQDQDVSHLEGALQLSPFLTRRLVGVLREAVACAMDWDSQQPPGSTNKPPFVDCCIFASSPEGIPTGFAVGMPVHLPDGRMQVSVEYTYNERLGTHSNPSRPLETWGWTDAVLLRKIGDQYFVDDFLYLRDSPREPPLLLSESFEGCNGPKWIGYPR
jgi:hypothetical protein